MLNDFLKNIKQDYPKSWSEFQIVAEDVLKASSATSLLKLDDMPFDMIFGIFLRFFKENDLEFDFNNLAPSEYFSEMRNLFASFETVIGHYS